MNWQRVNWLYIHAALVTLHAFIAGALWYGVYIAGIGREELAEGAAEVLVSSPAPGGVVLALAIIVMVLSLVGQPLAAYFNHKQTKRTTDYSSKLPFFACLLGIQLWPVAIGGWAKMAYEQGAVP